MPKAVLCHGSKWFESALTEGRFEEGITRKIRLPDDCPDAMGCLFYHMHQSNLAWPDFPANVEKLGEELLLCMRVWALGDKYFMPTAQDAAMLRICALLQYDISDGPLSSTQLARCYEACNDESAPRTLISDYVVDRMERNPSAFIEGTPLGGLPGFLPLMHESEKARNQLPPKDFPRYDKPRKHSKLLKVTPQNDETGVEEEGCSYYGSAWDQSSTLCDECGFKLYTSLRSYCKGCESSMCVCAQHVVQLCEDCVP